jgi:mono/diheme cytochrome c family protein
LYVEIVRSRKSNQSVQLNHLPLAASKRRQPQNIAPSGHFNVQKKTEHTMLRKLSLLLVMASMTTFATAQVNWATDIAPILYEHCANCHRDGGLGGFSLVGYSNAYSNRYQITEAVTSRQMPPWKADPTYRHYVGENLLTEAEITRINQWVDANAPAGNLTEAPPEPVFIEGSNVGVPDAMVQTPSYTMTATTDEYRCFVIPSGVTQDRFLRGLEVLPGNHMAVHHVLVYQDVTGEAAQLDAQTPEPGYISFGGPGVNGATLIGAWVPGARIDLLPPFMGVKLKANADLVIQVHFPGAATGLTDQSVLNMFFTPSNTGIREVRLAPILNHAISIQTPLFIPANTVRTFEERYTLPGNASIISVAPHMHLLGQNMTCFAVQPGADTIPLIRIPDWDFHWQGSYTFQKVQPLTAGTVLKAFATYDNTTNNPHNPSSPPQDVSVGEATTDEMMLVYFAWMNYLPGDENIVLDSSLLSSTVRPTVPQPIQSAQIRPNPVSGPTAMLELSLDRSTDVSLRLADQTGRIVQTWPTRSQLSAGRQIIELPISSISTGQYILYMQTAEGAVRALPLIVGKQ